MRARLAKEGPAGGRGLAAAAGWLAAAAGGRWLAAAAVGLAAALALAAAAIFPAGAAGQYLDRGAGGAPRDSRGEVFGYANLALPTGEFERSVELGLGVGLGGVLLVESKRMLGLRGEGSFMIYGRESYKAPLSTTVPIDVDVTTTNAIVSAGLGPQVYLLTGRVRPYVFGTVGFSYFVTETSVSGSSDKGLTQDTPFASSVNLGDWNMALNGGGGISFEVFQDDVALAIDLSASYQRNGVAKYLIVGDVGDARDRGLRRGGTWGEVLPDPIVSDANLLSIRIGGTLRLY